MGQSRSVSARRVLMVAMLAGLLALPTVTRQAHSAETALSCTPLDESQAPGSAEEWLARSRLASHCYSFQARAVRIGAAGVRTLALSHEVREGRVREVARLLDGPPGVHERQGSIAYSDSGGGARATPAAVESLSSLYRLSLAGEERIAGRSTHVLEIEPLDNLRYGRRLWLDAETALPLKQILLDERGRALETFQVTKLQNPRLYSGDIKARSPSVSGEHVWQPGWLPSGFEPQAVSADASQGQQRYGDGLSTLSLFVEPISGQPLLKPGLHRLGVSHAAVRHLEVDGEPHQLVILGELPPSVLQRVAESVEWQSEPTTASATPDDSVSP
ncbi:MucB/RseB C-terminal domain-containing protein [Halomonas sp. 18H]|uniref:MucB/RseB C-terminal domain-containing protein n=1 Tax=Halomonas almeriensis TaxID=308163 RepID=UPI00222EA9B1|nr:MULTISPECIES: MucB/RseB C-terminal domain-containing protein [Halomonas]MCW4152836.1 MucB/RseB C-terminal domain-containing protein [Halomonas sp. 18H]MDN3551876.1 MucB/RseB C-terminal domain-containing protein [Halomonas almeriensis]